jgi:hypothetical protein
MTLPASGAISLNQVNVELGFSGTASINMGSADVRGLFGVASGAIAMSDGYGKSNAWPIGTTYIFGNGNKTGPVGPTSGEFATLYTGVKFYDGGHFSSSTIGVQSVAAAFCVAGTYTVKLYGSVGRANSVAIGGPGSVIQGTLTIGSAAQFNFIVGQIGTDNAGNNYSGAGGGGSFFWTGADPTTAGNAQAGAGGGGGASTSGPAGIYPGQNGATDITGNTTNGGSGASTSTDYSAGGGGWSNNGADTSGAAGDLGGAYSVTAAAANRGRGFTSSGGGSGGFGGGGGHSNGGANRSGAGGGWNGGNGENVPSVSGGGGSKFDGTGWSSTSYVTTNAATGSIEVTRTA